MHLPFRKGGLNLQPNFKKGAGGLAGPQLLEGVAGKERVTFFRGEGEGAEGGLQFSQKK